jgi:hypothetical protein
LLSVSKDAASWQAVHMGIESGRTTTTYYLTR